jgi:hypothetical protein
MMWGGPFRAQVALVLFIAVDVFVNVIVVNILCVKGTPSFSVVNL